MKRSNWIHLILGSVVVFIAASVSQYGDFVGENPFDPKQMERVDQIVAAYKPNTTTSISHWYKMGRSC